jgi:general secretion pathway protein K
LLKGSEYSKEYIINLLSSLSSDDYLKVVPMLCHRKDDELLINVNALEIQHSKLVRAMLLNIFSEEDIANVILSKPEGGWISNSSFYISIHNSLSITKDNMKKLEKIILSNFMSDKYYLRLLLWDTNVSYYKLVSDLLITQGDVTVLSRSYINHG